MKAYSTDLRQRIVDAFDSGMTAEAVAEQYQVSSGTVRRYKRHLQRRRTLEPKKRPGRVKKIQESQYETLKQFVRDDSNATLQSLCDKFEDKYGTSVTVSVMCYTLKRIKITRKKRVKLPPSVTKLSVLLSA
jgi:transposase